MRYATLTEEKKLWKKGYKNITCLDEAGRGPLAGPVVAGAVMIDWRSDLQLSNFRRSDLHGIRDSKQLSPKRREKFYNLITKNKNIRWGIGIISERVIDKINILEATKLAMIKAIKDISCRHICTHKRRVKKYREVRPPKIDFLVLDGKMKLNLPILQKSIVKGDEKVFSCAAASIIAKVTRDRLMLKYHKKYPRYRFDLHKGYGTKLHIKILHKFGRCGIHRRSFKLGEEK